MVPVMMDGVCSPAYFQQMASSALPVYQAPFSSMHELGWLGSGLFAEKPHKAGTGHGTPREE